MKIYDEVTLKEMDSYDPDLGRIYETRRFVAHHDAVEPAYDYRIMPGTEEMNDGKGLKERYVVTPGQAAYDEYEDCYFYHAYTEEELKELEETPADPGSPSDLARNQVWDEFAKAFSEGVNSI